MGMKTSRFHKKFKKYVVQYFKNMILLMEIVDEILLKNVELH